MEESRQQEGTTEADQQQRSGGVMSLTSLRSAARWYRGFTGFGPLIGVVGKGQAEDLTAPTQIE